MKVIFQVTYPIKLMDTGVDLKIQKVFSDHIPDPHYETGSGSGFGVREQEADCDSEYVTAAVVQSIEDDVKEVFIPFSTVFAYSSKIHKNSKSDDPAYKEYRVISFHFRRK